MVSVRRQIYGGLWGCSGVRADVEDHIRIGYRIFAHSDSGEYETVPEAADAQIYPERGVIITTTTAINPVAAEGFGTDSFHNGDYSLYYYNLQENVGKRIEAYFHSNFP